MSAPEPQGAGARLDHEAAEWLIRSDRGLTPAEQDEFSRWLAADPRHRERLVEFRAGWQDFNLLAQWRPEHSAEPNPDLLARHPRTDWWVPAILAGVAACLVFTLAWRRETRSVMAAPSAAISSEAGAPAYERRVLEDGSILELNQGAVVEVQYTAGERHVSLRRGEASFTVAKNKNRPFIVRAGGVDVRAVGTVFNVRLDPALVEVLVSEGRVHVTPPVPAPRSAAGASTGRAAPELPLVVAGQRAVVPLTPGAAAPQVLDVSQAEMARLLAWQPRLLDFSSTPLAEVVAEFNRHNRTQIVISDADLASLPIVASFRSDNIEGFTRLLELTTNVRADHRGNGDIELRRLR